MARKVRFSDKAQAKWERHERAADYVLSQFQLGDPRGNRLGGADGDTVTVWNDEEDADDRRAGEILELGDLKTSNLDDRLLWLHGVKPVMANAFGVLLDAIEEDGQGDVQLTGPCVALVNVISASHKYASPKKDSYVLQSCPAGPVRILYKSSGTGEKTCAVLLTGDSTQLVKPVATIAKGDDGDCKIWLNGADTEATVNLLALGAEVPGGKYATQWAGFVLPWECEDD